MNIAPFGTWRTDFGRLAAARMALQMTIGSRLNGKF